MSRAREIFGELSRMFPLQWEMRRAYRLPSSEPGQPYFIAWDAAPRPVGEGWVHATFDERGVLVTERGQYLPVTIAQFAFHEYARYAASEANDAKVRFLAQAEYFVRAQRADGGYPYEEPLPDYGATAGWLSGMAQGEAASVLLRAHSLTNDERFRDAGVRALEPLKHDTRAGGASFIRDGAVFFEEVATPEPCHILNGHLFAAFGVWEYARLGLGSADVRLLHEDAAKTLARWLRRFDDDGWSLYDLAIGESGARHIAPLWYHHFHIAQLNVYAQMTGNPLFHDMADRWERALGDIGVRARVWRRNATYLARDVRRRLAGKPRAAFSAPDPRTLIGEPELRTFRDVR